MDKDLEDFVVKADEVEIGEAEEDAYRKYLSDLAIDDARRKQAEMNAVIYGRNKKRTQAEVFGEQDGDDEEFL